MNGLHFKWVWYPQKKCGYRRMTLNYQDNDTTNRSNNYRKIATLDALNDNNKTKLLTCINVKNI
jgi:hypothetical protein